MDVEMLKRKRSVIKQQLTIFKRYLDSIGEDVNQQVVTNIETRLSKIVPLYDQFDEIQLQIESVEQVDADLISDEREQVENKYFELIARAKSFHIKELTSQQTVVEQINNEQSNTSTHTVTRASDLSNVKLPRITLPTFDGNFTKWREFFDTFKALVDSNETITDAQKLCYLKSSVRGEPANLLTSFETIDINYNIAFDLLKERYNNIRRIVHNHVRALLEIDSITKESHSTLRNLIDQAEKHIRCLKSLDQPTEQWDAIIVPILSAKLDHATNRDWETKLNSENTSKDFIPTYKEFITFLNQKQYALEAITTRKSTGDTLKSFNLNKRVTAYTTNIDKPCLHCNKSTHNIYNCEAFLQLNIEDRISRIKELKACINCLKKGHFAGQCKSGSCKTCQKKHNSLLHIEKSKENNDKEVNTLSASCSSCKTHYQTLLSTAILHYKDKSGNTISARALLDSGSQSCYMTEELAQKLAYPQITLRHSITGVGKTELNIDSQVHAEASCSDSKYKFKTFYLIIPTITEKLPLASFNKGNIKIPQTFKLADPYFHKRGNIDILIGASIFWEVLGNKQIKLGVHGPILQDTKFGWIVCGNIPKFASANKAVTGLAINELNEQIQRFWKLDEYNNTKLLTEEEKFCEKYFNETVSRNFEGRFIVRVPFKGNQNKLGESYKIAKERFENLEYKFNKNNNLKVTYANFIHEYETLQHMSKIKPQSNELAVYLPHHGVFKESSTTTKLRVVFDASCKTTSGLSLNDTQCVGPTVQSDLLTIILNFRLLPYVAIGDIEKMYRQVLVHPKDRKYQRILWREDPTKPIEIFELNTVTYGTASAPYLAIKCLMKLAEENEQNFPEEANLIKRNFYVDDLLMGANTIQELKIKRDNIVNILATAKFHLRKWNSNVSQLSDTHNSVSEFKDAPMKTLGILWDSEKDIFLYRWQIAEIKNNIATKRVILSTTAKLFDPLGLLSPITIIPKLLIQELWHNKIDWDETIPINLQETWNKLKQSINDIQHIGIPRYVVNCTTNIQLFGFSDASERAFGACVYLRTMNDKCEVKVMLLAAKSRVAPLRTTTVPRLELCAAVLLAKLVNKVKEAVFNSNVVQQYLWTDSEIVLAWINAEPAVWSTYVGNRVAKIHDLTKPEHWHHVKSEENPADIISRGTTTTQLIDNKLWWEGPDWLINFNNYQIQETKFLSNIPEKRKCINVSTKGQYDLSIFQKYSNLDTLINVMSYCYRFCSIQNKNRNNKSINVQERQTTLEKIIKVVQNNYFANEILYLKKSNMVPKNSKLLILNPFLDNVGLLRVGGRLENANINFENRHQIILPAHDNLTKLIGRHEHETRQHCGPQTLLNNMRQVYWPLNGKNFTKQIFRSCIKCFKVNPKRAEFFMGNLPSKRVNVAPPFSISGVDYAGPFWVKERKAKNPKKYKSYICIFVCFVSKAIHIELVSDLTTDCFLGALKRFISRRGKPKTIFSDNATNFTGANKDLANLIQSTNVENVMSKDYIQWKFIPPRSPHMGGLWEAGVRSVKIHLKRVVGDTVLTIEQIQTLLCQIEAILNSRPLSSISDNPNDLNPLTPGHFLIGRSLSANILNNLPTKINNKALFSHVHTMTEHFWKRWQREYLHQLQMRYKWNNQHLQPKPGDLVVLVVDNLPSLSWRLGRIKEVHPGNDGIVRVVTIKTQKNIVKRALTKVCFLPSNVERSLPFQEGRDV